MSAEVPAVLGSYVIERELGRGGMGAVYVGVHQVLGRRAAIKVLLPALSQRDDLVQRFFTEARAVTAIQHASIVDVYDFGTAADGSAYIVMEYLEGESLAARLRTRGRLPVPQALAIARQIATGLAAAHAVGVIHRDLKPDNIFLVPDPEVVGGERAKLLDFGVAKLVAADTTSIKTMTGMLLGTPQYMSPEQCEGAREVDHRSDLYSLGCTLFQMVCGRLPFVSAGIGGVIGMHLHMPPPKLRTHAPHASAALEAIVDRLLAKDPGERPATATEVAAALAEPEAAVVSAAAALPATLPAIAGSEPTLATRVPSQGAAEPGPDPEPRDAGAGNPATVERGVVSTDAAPPAAPRHGGRWLASAVAIVAIAAVTVIALTVLRDDPTAQPSLATTADAGGDAVTTVPSGPAAPTEPTEPTVPTVRTVPTVPAMVDAGELSPLDDGGIGSRRRQRAHEALAAMRRSVAEGKRVAAAHHGKAVHAATDAGDPLREEADAIVAEIRQDALGQHLATVLRANLAGHCKLAMLEASVAAGAWGSPAADAIVTTAEQCTSIVKAPGAGRGEEPMVAIARLHREGRHREAFVVCELHRGAARRRAFECTTAACAGNEPAAARRHMRFVLQTRRVDAMAVCQTYGVDLSVR